MSSLPPNAGFLLLFLKGEGDTHRKRESDLEAVVLLPLSQAGYKAPLYPLLPWKWHGVLLSAGDSRGSAVLGSHHVTRKDRLAVGVHGAVPQHQWQLLPWGTTLKGLCYVTVNCYVTASKCSYRKACASNTPACPDHSLLWIVYCLGS